MAPLLSRLSSPQTPGTTGMLHDGCVSVRSWEISFPEKDDVLGYAPCSPPPRRYSGRRTRSAAWSRFLGIRGARPRRHGRNTGPPRTTVLDASRKAMPRDSFLHAPPERARAVLGLVPWQPHVLESSGTRTQPSPPRTPNPTPQTMPCEDRALSKRPRNTEEAQDPRCPRVLTQQHRPPRGPDGATSGDPARGLVSRTFP